MSPKAAFNVNFKFNLNLTNTFEFKIVNLIVNLKLFSDENSNLNSKLLLCNEKRVFNDLLWY